MGKLSKMVERKACVARRRIKKKGHRVPSWYDHFQVKLYYRWAVLYTRMLGKQVTVDHIIPLNHPRVCGLHCHHNMQLLFEKANGEKGNKFYV